MKKLFNKDLKVRQIEVFNSELEKFSNKVDTTALSYFLNVALFDSFGVQSNLHKPIGDLVTNTCFSLPREFKNIVYLDFPLSFNEDSPTWMQACKAGNLRRWIDWWQEYSKSFEKDSKLNSKQFVAWIKKFKEHKDV